MKIADDILLQLSRSGRVGFVLMRIAIAIVFIWIGWLKFAPYEADSITPFVANNPVMSLFYAHPEQYQAHLTREGELVPAQRTWQQENHTYAFADGLGTVEITIGLLVLCGLVPTALGAALGTVGAVLAFLTSFVTLSFLVTTPEAWVPALGSELKQSLRSRRGTCRTHTPFECGTDHLYPDSLKIRVGPLRNDAG